MHGMAPVRVTKLLLMSLLTTLLSPPIQCFAETQITFDTISPGLITTQLQSSGVRFVPTGVIVAECSNFSNCGSAHSGARIATAPFNGEFARFPVEVQFTALQRRVSLYAKSEYGYTPAKNIIATLNAYDDTGAPVGSQTRTFLSSTWQQLTVGSLASSARIKRVVLSGQLQDGLSGTNFLLIDDIAFEGDPPTPPSDTVLPSLSFVAPAISATITSSSLLVKVNAQDNRELQSVRGG